ncbi:T9SS type A sorting domain-containing protein [Emticicia agri]|uniref:T9SS type A sorting domain-containing protein n=1 Tax=Emticicia agri TaxID=2492393 RepID=A0A4Q5LZG6_9BACT|nr:T9SS type A sorting domain-containing protein [Emticicia agri]RYU95376.1 T9SS type A sorting domain-containing protein [Emticicia agri]
MQKIYLYMPFFSDNRPVIICRSVILLLLISLQTAYSQTVQLPFFDDFSTTIGPVPDPRLWVNGGTHINNTFPLNQPSKNVATFDGRTATGLPYDYINQLAYGRTDSLTSRPINLAASQPADSLYLSFFWQARGIGELPDDDDTLMVSFLSKSNQWRVVWKQAGGIRSDVFEQELIAIKDTSFFHAGFQFRFETKGRQSGAFDTWHLDYVYLNKNRRSNDIYTKDIACTRFVSSYLKRYSAMPMRQYKVNPAAEVNDTLRAQMFNLQADANFPEYAWKIEEVLSRRVYYNSPGTAFGTLAPRITGTRQLIFQPITDLTANRAILKFQFSVTTADAIQPNLPGYNLALNDSISTYTILDDFYAYDDGTAEIGADFDQTLGKVAVQYILSKPDSIGAVRFNFSPYFSNPYLKDTTVSGGQYFLLQLLESDKGKPGKTLHQQSIRAEYGKAVNHFKEYALNQNVAIKDTFYVAWTKITQEVIAVGVDKNTPQFADKIFYNNGDTWLPNTTLKGSLMVRPVVATKPSGGTGGPGGVTSTEEPFGEPLVVYPNPTSGILKWNLTGIKYIRIIDMGGREVLSRKVDGQEMNIGNLPANTYLVNFSDGKKNLIHKIVVVN